MENSLRGHFKEIDILPRYMQEDHTRIVTLGPMKAYIKTNKDKNKFLKMSVFWTIQTPVL